MKRKSLLVLSLAALATSSTFAMEIYKGKLVSHKEWTTKGVTAIHQPSMHRENPMNMTGKKSKDDAESYASVYTGLQKTSVVAGNMANISGNLGLYVENESQTLQEYYYTFEMCAYLDEHNARCSYVEDKFQLEPGGAAYYYEAPVLQTQFNTPGSFRTMLYANIDKGVPEDNIFFSSSFAESTIEVTNSKA